MKMIERMIDYLNRNRVSTTEVADCLGKTGVIPGLMPSSPGHYRAGKIVWIYASQKSSNAYSNHSTTADFFLKSAGTR